MARLIAAKRLSRWSRLHWLKSISREALAQIHSRRSSMRRHHLYRRATTKGWIPP